VQLLGVSELDELNPSHVTQLQDLVPLVNKSQRR
jgi:hypothetical protein